MTFSHCGSGWCSALECCYDGIFTVEIMEYFVGAYKWAKPCGVDWWSVRYVYGLSISSGKTRL